MNTSNARRVRRAFSRAAPSYDAAGSIQREVVEQLLDRLPPGLRADTILDIGCGTGFAFPGLSDRFPDAQLIGLDFSEAMLSQATQTDPLPPPPARRLQKICADAAFLPVASASAELLLSSMTFQWCALNAALQEAHRVLRPAGTLAFSTLTGETFSELRQAFAGIDDAPHALPLLSPETIMAQLNMAGFTGGAAFRKLHRARFINVRALFDSIRQTGAGEVAPEDANDSRRRGLLGKAAFATINQRLRALADAEGLIPLSYDVLYVTATKPGAQP